MAFIFPYIFALVYWILFFSVIGYPSLVPYALIALVVGYGITVVAIAGKEWYRHWNIFINYLLFFVTSFGFVLIMSSTTVRNIYIILSGAVSGLLIYILATYFKNQKKFTARVYLQFTSFMYLVTLWQFYALLFFILISYDPSKWETAMLAMIGSWLLSRGIILLNGLKKSSSALVLLTVTLTTGQLFIFLELLPVHYYVLASLLTVWFFYIMEMVLRGQELASRRPLFRTYTVLVLLVMIALLVTANWG